MVLAELDRDLTQCPICKLNVQGSLIGNNHSCLRELKAENAVLRRRLADAMRRLTTSCERTP